MRGRGAHAEGAGPAALLEGEGAGLVGNCGSERAATPGWAGGGTGHVCVKFQKIGGQNLTLEGSGLLLTLDGDLYF